MPRISHETIEAVKSRIPLEEVVSPVVTLSRSGKNWKGLSPFSNEKSPSFFVLTDKNIFKCFSSGLAGDVIRFVQETEKLTFYEAILTLAERFSIEVKYEEGFSAPQENRSLRRALIEIHEYAADFYHQALLAEDADAGKVREYWTEQRGFSLELAKTLKIGFAPAQSQKLNQILVKKGFDDEAIRKAGLFYGSDTQQAVERLRPRFRGRLMIPIRNLQGQIVAFTARQLAQTPADDPAHDAKYINSPETPIFIKGQMLFNLDRARESIREKGYFLLVEGQLDAIRCWQGGFTTAIAPQGTAVTEEQLRLLRRYAEKLEVLLDGDSAGRTAAMRLLPLAIRADLDVRFLELPPGTDPDALIREKGNEGLEAIREQGLTAMEFAAKTLMPEGDAQPAHKGKVLEQIFAIIGEADSAITRSAYLEEAVACTNSPAEAAQLDFARWEARRHQRQQAPAAAQQAVVPAGGINSKKLTTTERVLLWIVLQDVNWANAVAQVMDHEWIDIRSPEGTMLARILAEACAGTWEGVEQAEHLFENQDERDCLYSVYADDWRFDDISAVARDNLQKLALRHLKTQIDELNAEIARQAGNPDAERSLYVRMREVQVQRMELRSHPPALDLQPLSRPEPQTTEI